MHEADWVQANYHPARQAQNGLQQCQSCAVLTLKNPLLHNPETDVRLDSNHRTQFPSLVILTTRAFTFMKLHITKKNTNKIYILLLNFQAQHRS